MDTERTRDVDRRAIVYAALAEPLRLAIVDALYLGDISPTELQNSFDVPSNLLAHHLRVLEDAGLVTRTKSEADRRRSYLRLVSSSLVGLTPGPTEQAKRVVFVCTANTARSQLAAAIWQDASPIPASSAGTHPAEQIDPGATAIARRHNLPLRAVRPRNLTDVLADGDYIITVCDNAHEEIHNHDGLHWSVPDPVRIGTNEAFEATFAELTRRVTDLAPRLAAS